MSWKVGEVQIAARGPKIIYQFSIQDDRHGYLFTVGYLHQHEANAARIATEGILRNAVYLSDSSGRSYFS
jgi:hypothetical protein